MPNWITILKEKGWIRVMNEIADGNIYFYRNGRMTRVNGFTGERHDVEWKPRDIQK